MTYYTTQKNFCKVTDSKTVIQLYKNCYTKKERT